MWCAASDLLACGLNQKEEFDGEEWWEARVINGDHGGWKAVQSEPAEHRPCRIRARATPVSSNLQCHPYPPTPLHLIIALSYPHKSLSLIVQTLADVRHFSRKEKERVAMRANGSQATHLTDASVPANAGLLAADQWC